MPARSRRRQAAATAVLMAAIVATTLIDVPAAAGSSSGPSFAVRHGRLANGLEIYVYEDATVPLVSVSLWYRVGSRDDPVGRRGMAHLMEHMMFKGSRRVGPEAHARLIQEAGGIANAFTTTDATVYWEKVPSSQLALALALEAERMAYLVITPEHLASEREVVKEEYRLRAQNDPIGVALDRFHALVFEGTPYAWTALGFLDDLDRVTVEDLEAFYRRYYVPNNAVLVVAGDTTLEEVLRLADHYFGPIPAGEEPPRPVIAFEAPRSSAAEGSSTLGRFGTLPMAIQVPGVLAGFAVPGAAHPDKYALGVATLVLSAGETSRLHQRLVREQQLAVVASGGPLFYADAGTFLAFSFYLPGHSPEAQAEALLAEVERLAHEPPTPEELERARNQLAASVAFQFDSLDGVANLIGSAVVMEGGIEAFTDGIQPYLSVTAEQVQRVARRYFVRDNATVVAIVPEAAAGLGQR
ncbi:MAG: insulinase family protein [Firmicutes bacterium]|nr:insulinase family protein [Bacillota bacterium]